MINKRYLNISFIKNKINEFQTKTPIWYVVFEDFIEKDFYKKCLEEFKNNGKNIIRVDNSIIEWRKNKTIFLEWNNLFELDNFFSSEKFEKFLSLFFMNNLEREFYINNKERNKVIWNKKWLLAQIYEKGDYYKWHVDGLDEWISLGSFIYYFNWYNNVEENNWGELELWKWDWWNLEVFKSIKPKSNTLILLLYSEKAFHRVTEIISDEFKRISIQATLKIKK